MPSEATRPWKMFLPLILVLALGAAWSIYWFVAIGIAKEKATEERRALESRGIALSCTKESWAGFPFRFEFKCTSPILKLQDKVEARSGNLLAVALAYNPWQVVLLVDGPTAVTGENLMPAATQHERIIASFTIGKGNAVNFSSDVPKLVVRGLLSADRIMAHTRPEDGGRTGFAVSLVKLNYQPEGRPPLQIDAGNLQGSLQPDQTVIVDRIELTQGSVRYWGAGTVQIDAGRRLSGKLATETNDLDGLLKILEPHLDMTDQEKAGFRTVLGLLGNEAKADIIAKDGQLFIGPFKVADLLPLY
jgi:hypothetical protein